MRVRTKIKSLVLACLGLFILFFAGEASPFKSEVHAQEKGYQVTEQAIQLNIDAKGQANIRYFVSLKAKQMNQIKLQLPKLDQKLRNYRVGKVSDSGTVQYLAETGSQLTGSFQLTQEKQMALLTITFPLNNEDAQFVVEYNLEQAVVNYQDGAYFQAAWVPLAENEQKKPYSVVLNIRLAGKLLDQDLHYWVNGGQVINGQLATPGDESQLSIEVERDSQANQPLTLKLIFPKSLTPHNHNLIEVDGVQAIINRENHLLEEEVQSQQSHYYWLLAKFFAFIIVPMLGTFLLFRYNRQLGHTTNHSSTQDLKMGQLPEDIPAALVNAQVYDQRPSSNELASTLLELGRKGYLKIIPVRMATRSSSRMRSGLSLAFHLPNDMPNFHTLPTYEKYALQMVQHEMGTKTTISLEEIIMRLRQSKSNRRTAQDLWKRYIEAVEVRSVANRQAQPNSYRILLAGIVFWLIFVCFLGVGMGIEFLRYKLNREGWLMVFFLFPHLLTIVYLLYIANRHRLEDARNSQRLKKWNQFKQILASIDQINLKNFGNIASWEAILPYAVSLNQTSRIQQAFTHYFDMSDLVKCSQSQNTDLYRVHGSIANILQPAIKEWVELLDPKRNWFS